MSIYSLDDVVGHKNIVSWFKMCISEDRLPSVILLTGRPGLGKTSIAKIVACEVAYHTLPEKIEYAKESVITLNKNTDAVHIYNMSNLRSEEEVLAVRNDLTVGISQTNRKVIILDEAHGMSNSAQDSLLTVFESLPENVWIIICTTETESLRDAFLSRSIIRRLNTLSLNDIKKLIRKEIESAGLRFEMRQEIVISLIANYTGNEPRRALNLINALIKEDAGVVTTSQLETFINTSQTTQIVSLLDKLYRNDVISGISFISELEIDATFVSSLVEALHALVGYNSTLLTRDATLHLQSLAQEFGEEKAIRFVSDCCCDPRLTRNKLTGYYLRYCKMLSSKPMQYSDEKLMMQDLNLIKEHSVEKQVTSNNKDLMVKTMDQWLSDGSLVNL